MLTNECRGDISAAQKREYIASVLCLMDKPSRFEAGRYPGVKSRYDDFVAVHINQTMTIHETVSTAQGLPSREKR
jgi:tyrosinase